MRKKISIKKIVLLVILVLIISGLAYVANAFNGNPISKYFAKNEYKKYVEATYPDTDFEVSRTWYNFKDGNYGADVISESRSLKFSVTKRYDDVINDDYRDGPTLMDYDNSLRFKDEITNEIMKEITVVDSNKLIKDIYVDISVPQGKYNEDVKLTKDIDEEIKVQVNCRREPINEKEAIIDKSDSTNKSKFYIGKEKEVVEKPVKNESVEAEEFVPVINDEFVNIAYEVKEIIVNMGYKGLTEIGFQFVDSNYNYEYILLEKENFNTSKEELINFKANESSIFNKSLDKEKETKLVKEIEVTLNDITGIENLGVYENKIDGGYGNQELYIDILKKEKPTKEELAKEVFNIKELVRDNYPEIKYLNIGFYEHVEENSKGGNMGGYYGSIFIGNEFSPWEITEEEANTKLKVAEGL